MWRRLAGGAAAAIVIAALPLPAQDMEGARQWISSHLEPLSIDRADSAAMPSGLATVVAGARIVGIGESAHHKQELLQLRSRLTRELVERHHFRAVAMETGYADALLLERWLREAGAAEPDLALALPYAGDGEMEEIRASLRWLKRYNEGRPLAERVRFIGVDLSNGGGALRPPFARVWEYLGRVDPSVANESRERVARILDRVGSGYSRTAKQRFDSLPAGDRSLLDREIASLRDRLTTHRAAYVRSSRAEEHERAVHALEVAAQTLEFMRADPRDPANPRDHALARNVEWALSTLPPRTRLVVWAHNAHVQKQPIDVPQMQMIRPAESMGGLLARRFGGQYRAIGTVVNRLPPDSTADSASVDALFASAGAGAPAFFLALRDTAQRSPAAAWLRAVHLMRFESLYMRTVPASAFDALVYVERAVPATRVK